MRYSPMMVTRSSYLSPIATRADSFWLADHLNSLYPQSMAHPKYIGAARLIPKVDANLEPWTVLTHLAARNRLGRLRLGIGVTDAGRRNPAVTAQAGATLHLLTRVSVRATNPTAWTGPDRWRGLKKRWPRSRIAPLDSGPDPMLAAFVPSRLHLLRPRRRGRGRRHV
jgi:hypothetical protein